MSEPLTPIDTVYRVIDEFADLIPRISVTEFDNADTDEHIAADYLRDFLTVVYSHPAVESFLMWGFWDGAQWRDDAPIYREDWSLKPSGQAFLDLVFDEWWTDIQALTNTDGYWEGRGFSGTYDVSATFNGSVVTREATLTGGDTTDVVLSLTDTRAHRPDDFAAFRVEPNFPNPVLDRTTINYTLAQPSNVAVEVFDPLGRRVLLAERSPQGPGRHALDLDVRALPAGVYVFRVSAGDHHHTGRMSVMR